MKPPLPKVFVVALVAVMSGPLVAARADDPPASAPTRQEAQKAEQAEADAAADKAAIAGPNTVQLGTEGMIELPAGTAFVPREPAARLLKAYGNTVSPSFLGVIVPRTQGQPWWATIEFVSAGYVKDDDAKTWNADELLHHIQDNTLAANEDRKTRGFPELEVTGWVEPPRYDEATHRLVWSALVKQIGADPVRGSINHNTYVLGREGYYSLDLVTGKAGVEATKAAAARLLASISFDKGKSYADFNASSDHIAEYGLAALVGGVALKKLGLLALGAAFALKFAKLIGIAAFGAIVAARKLFSRSRSKLS